jgi:hypothetical protein
MVKVVVGEDTTTSSQSFFVHADLLTSRSAFFAKALRTYAKANQSDKGEATHSTEDQSIQWREGEEGVIKLPVDEPQIFVHYVQLLYAGVLPIFDDPKKPEMDPITTTEDERKKLKASFEDLMCRAVTKVHNMLGKLYVFCEKIQDATAKQDLLASFVKECSETHGTGFRYFPLAATVRDIYSGTLPSDPLRAYIVDCHVYVGHSEWLDKEDGPKDYPHDFLFDFMAATYKVRAKPLDNSRIGDTKYYLDKLIEIEEEDTEEDLEV